MDHLAFRFESLAHSGSVPIFVEVYIAGEVGNGIPK